MGKTAMTTRKKAKKIEMQSRWKKRNKEVVSKRVIMKMMIKGLLDRNLLIAKSAIREEDALVQDQGRHPANVGEMIERHKIKGKELEGPEVGVMRRKGMKSHV